MTARKAMISRCLDCCVTFKCALDCPLFGFVKLKTNINWLDTILEYCQWCRNRDPANQCMKQNCAIFQYLTNTDEFGRMV